MSIKEFNEQENKLLAEGSRVVISRFFCGLLYMQVCCVADATDEEILKACNDRNPSGTSNGWCHVVRLDTDKNKEPGPCQDHPGRVHILVSC